MSLSPTKILLPRFLVHYLLPNPVSVAFSLLLITLTPLVSIDGISRDPKSWNQPLSEAAQSGHYVTPPTPPLQFQVSVKDGFVIPKVKNEHVEQAEEFTNPSKPICPVNTETWYRSQGGWGGKNRKKNAEKCSLID